jgi:O-antigen/teichoic acid export membrane protein
MLSFTVTSGLHTINRRADLIMVGALLGMNAAGIYAVVSYGAMMINFIILATNVTISPTAAKSYAENNQPRLQWITAISARLVFISSLLFCSLFILFGRKILLIFGPDFTKSYDAFVILTVGRTVQISMGLSGMLLNMTGYERETAIGTALGALLNIVLNALLIPVWGLVGAACATVIGGLSTVILLNYRCGLRLGIKPSVFNTLKMNLKLPDK